MRTIKNVDYQVTVDLVQLARKHPEGIPHDAARVMLHKHLGGRSVTHLVQRLQAEGIVLAVVKPPRVPKGKPETAPADPAQTTIPEGEPAQAPAVEPAPVDAAPAAPVEDPIAPSPGPEPAPVATPAEIQDAQPAPVEPEAVPAEGVA